jgi:hypothetical protein
VAGVHAPQFEKPCYKTNLHITSLRMIVPFDVSGTTFYTIHNGLIHKRGFVTSTSWWKNMWKQKRIKNIPTEYKCGLLPLNVTTVTRLSNTRFALWAVLHWQAVHEQTPALAQWSCITCLTANLTKIYNQAGKDWQKNAISGPQI